MNNSLFPLFIILLSIIVSCDNDPYQPKPKAYFRLEFPEKTYESYNPPNCPFQFDKLKLARIIPYPDSTKKCWMNISYPRINGKIHLSYNALHEDLSRHIEESRMLVYKHTVKANDIQEYYMENDSNNTYAILYRIKGNTASSVQFFITDSVNHFFRGALYFSSHPNEDSLNPSINYIEQDIEKLIESFAWKN